MPPNQKAVGWFLSLGSQRWLACHEIDWKKSREASEFAGVSWLAHWAKVANIGIIANWIFNAQTWHIELRIEAKEGKHRLPHFHIRFKSEYRASYSIDDCKHLKGEMPRRYQEPILEWARENRDRLKSAWDDAMAGKHPVIIEAKASSGT